MATTFKIEGLKELQRGLEQFKKSTQRGILERALKKAAKPIVDDAKTLAPVDSGDLKKSITTKVIRSSAGKTAYGKAKRGGASDADAVSAARAANRAASGQGASALVRVQATAPHSIFVEFGTSNHNYPRQPFMGPALLGNRANVMGTLKSDLETEMIKSAKRIAARAAKKGKS